MVTAAIHRLVEQHAAARPGVIAVAEADRSMSYRELNFRANSCARKLMAHGFRRGAHAVVRMEPSADLAVALLAVLKAGGSYTWIDPRRGESAFPTGLWISVAGPATPDAYMAVQPEGVLACDAIPSPNLPVLTRPGDIACVLQGADGVPEVLVPHATIVDLNGKLASADLWMGEAGAIDLWMLLMSGATAATTTAPATAVTATAAEHAAVAA